MKFKRIKIVTSLLFLACLFLNTVRAEEILLGDNMDLGLDDALDIAVNQNYALLKQNQENKVFKLRATEEFTTLLPTLRATADYTYNTRVGEFGIADTEEVLQTYLTDMYEVSVMMVQPVTGLYKNSLKYRIAKENYNISNLETKLQNDIVINNVSDLYFDILKQQKLIEVLEKDHERLDAYYKVAYDRYTAGEALARDYLKVQIEIDNLQHRIFKAKNLLHLYNTSFKEILGLELDQHVNVVEKYTSNTYENQPLEELQQVAIENRPELEQFSKAIEITRLDRKAAIAEYLPDVDFIVAYNNQSGSIFTPHNNLIFGVRAKYNFWQWGKKHLSIKQQKALIEKSNLDLKEMERKVAVEVESRYNQVIEANDFIQVCEKTVLLSEENLRITNDRYKIGMALITDLLDDQTALLDSQIKLINSKLDYQKDLIELEKTMGVISMN